MRHIGFAREGFAGAARSALSIAAAGALSMTIADCATAGSADLSSSDGGSASTPAGNDASLGGDAGPSGSMFAGSQNAGCPGLPPPPVGPRCVCTAAGDGLRRVRLQEQAGRCGRRHGNRSAASSAAPRGCGDVPGPRPRSDHHRRVDRGPHELPLQDPAHRLGPGHRRTHPRCRPAASEPASST
jgi:hypothetical protein